MLQVRDLRVSFGDNLVLRGVNVEIRPGEFVGMIGPSGGGKSVFLKTLAGVLKPDSGTVSVGADSAASRVGFLFQEGALFDSMTVLENVAFPLSVGSEATPYLERSQRAYDMLREVGLGDAALKYPGQLSGGMRRRVGIARALVSHPPVVLLDDPTGGLDPVAASIIMDLIRDLHRQYLPTVIVVSHDLRRLLPSVERVLALFDGQIVLDVVPEELQERADPEVLDFVLTRFDFDELHNHPHTSSP